MTPSTATTDRSATLIHDLMPDSIPVRPSDHDLTVIIPAHEEQQRLPWTLAQIKAFLDTARYDYRILVVDDGSRDRTASIASEFGPRCSTLRLACQGGKGRAVRNAMLRATGRILAFTDADLPFHLSALQTGYELLTQGRCNVVFGARDMAESTHLARRRIARHLATRVFRTVVNCLISREVTDTQCGLKLFTRQAALEIFSRVTIDGFAFDAEVVFLTHRLGYTFRRIPVTLINDYSSTLSLRRNALPMLADVLRVWFRAHFGRSLPTPHFEGNVEPESVALPKKAA
ncbi:MAG: glycosyltransferase [Pirellulales bacterium]|nr:glycosyltransferase [Pirellulales bacterium]